MDDLTHLLEDSFLFSRTYKAGEHVRIQENPTNLIARQEPL